MKKWDRDFYSILGRVYIRDQGLSHVGEAVLLACLLHSKGQKAKDMEDVWRIMRDHNHS